MSDSNGPKKTFLKATALSLVRKGEPERGAEKYREYLEFNDQDDDAWAGLGGALRRMGDVDAAIDCYAKAFKINPQSSYAGVNVISLLAARNTPGDADPDRRTPPQGTCAYPVEARGGVQSSGSMDLVRLGDAAVD